MNKQAIDHLRKDPVMARLVAQIGPIRHRAEQLQPFESLIHAIIHQQLSGKAASTILGRFLDLFGQSGFPHPEAIIAAAPESLRSAGLSRAKTSYIQDIALRAVGGKIPTLEECDKLSDSEIIRELTTIKGVGRWTVGMFLIFNLGRPDVLPIHDLGVQRGFQIAHGRKRMPDPRILEKYGGKWAPFRTAAALYFWRAVDTRED